MLALGNREHGTPPVGRPGATETSALVNNMASSKSEMDHPSQRRTGLQGRVCSPWRFVLQASLGRFPRDTGAGWGAGYPKDSSSQQDSPLASQF